MHLTDKQIQEFQELYKEKFGLELDKQDAIKKGIKLVLLVKQLVSLDDSFTKAKTATKDCL